MSMETVSAVNCLSQFLGIRDLPELTVQALRDKYQLEKVDVMVLFGGSILCGGDLLAQAMKEGMARYYIIVGGAGHTTEALRQEVKKRYPFLDTEQQPEAKVFAAYLKTRYDLEPDYLECDSTNCGNNITYLLKLLKEKKIDFQSILMIQDASMQRRMDAGLQKYVDESITIINYAAYQAFVALSDNKLVYKEEIPGMWDMERYLSLLLGELPRLSDTPTGYGPLGKDYIDHVDIPPEVEAAFSWLKQDYGNLIRKANPAFASK